MRLTTIALAAIALLLLVAMALAPAMRADLGRVAAAAALASTEAPADTPLADVLSGRHQPGFFPELDGVVEARPRPGRVAWLRLQAELDAGERWYVRLERAPIRRVAVLLPDQPALERAESHYFRLGQWDARWPDGFVLPLPAGLSGPVTVYLRVEGDVDAELRPQVIDGDGIEARAAAAFRLFALVYGLLLLALVASRLPALQRIGGGGWGMAGLVLASAATIALVNDQLPPLLRAVLDPWLGGSLVFASTLFLAGALLVATREQSGLAVHSTLLALWYRRIGIGLMLLAPPAALVPAEHADLLRRTAETVWSQAWLLVLIAFALDRRRLRWLPMLLLLLLLGLLVVRALAAGGAVPASALALYGYQLLIALLLLVLVLLPWLRGLPVEAPKPPPPAAPPPSPEEAWRRAETRMVAAIDGALRYGGAADADWVVARRLLDTVLSLTDASSAAVVRALPHREHQVVAEPAGVEAAYARLLRERTRMLRSLLRLGAPQQVQLPIGESTASHVALLPYAVEDEGWTALLVERREQGFEVDELARLATLAAAARSAAGSALAARRQALRADLDPALAVLNAEALQRELRASFDRCRDAGEPIALLRLPLAGAEGVEARARRWLAAVDAQESLPSHLLGRSDADELWLVLPGLDVPAARVFAEALHRQVAPPVPTSGLLPPGARPAVADWVIGLAAIQPGERVPRPMIERAGEALARARVPGAGAVQAVVPVLH